jgi:hypothetical protein
MTEFFNIQNKALTGKITGTLGKGVEPGFFMPRAFLFGGHYD